MLDNVFIQKIKNRFKVVTIVLSILLTLQGILLITPSHAQSLKTSSPITSINPNATNTITINKTQIFMGQSEADVLKILGKPNREDLSEYGFTWYIYNKDYENYVQVGIQNKKVVAIYSNATSFSLNGSIKFGKDFKDTLKTIQAKTSQNEEFKTVRLNDSDVTLFFDKHDSDHLTAVLLLNQSLSDVNVFKNLQGKNRTEILRGFEYQLMDLANSSRARFKKTPFILDEKLANVARNHSQDMAKQNFFSHDSKDGRSPFDRMESAGLEYSLAAENIAAGQSSAIFAHECWMNSFGHRNNILSEATHFGAGIGYVQTSDYGIYYTENFRIPE